MKWGKKPLTHLSLLLLHTVLVLFAWYKPPKASYPQSIKAGTNQDRNLIYIFLSLAAFQLQISPTDLDNNPSKFQGQKGIPCFKGLYAIFLVVVNEVKRVHKEALMTHYSAFF